MGILDETRFVERLRFFDGQRLFAPDLQGIEAFHREMRWLHNRSLHQTGIGNGFAVSGERGAREVRIGPGYALDSLGREIVLTHEQVEPIPPVAGEADGQSVFFDLVVSYDEDPEAAETREGICLSRGVVRLREEPVLCFVRLEREQATGNLRASDLKLRQEILDGLRVVLARLEVIDCRLYQTISLAQRRSARPSLQPFLACGEVDAAFAKLEGLDLFHLHQLVDTSSADFQTTPCYSVRLAGERLRLQEPDDGIQGIDFFILDGEAQVLEATAKSFVVDVLIEVRGPNPPSELSDWKVVWMGVE